MGMARRIHALEKTFSGVAAEARIVAELVRCGLKVAKPYWTNDEMDLLILYHEGDSVLTIPVQVKSVQFLESKSRKCTNPRFLQALKKRYIEKNPALCLAIYRPDEDRIWFIDGAENIKTVYDENAIASGRPRYCDLREESEVAIRLTLEKCPLDAKWLVPPRDAKWLSDRISRVSKSLLKRQRHTAQIKRLLGQYLEENEDE
jgi:hypothetical protein